MKIKTLRSIPKIAMALVFLGFSQPAMADQTENFTFNVNVSNVLDVTVSPTPKASGSVGDFLRTGAHVIVSTNSEHGATAKMTTKTTTTALTNGAATIPTLGSNTTRGNFPAGYWGTSLTDTASGSDSSTYLPLVPSNGTPMEVLQTSTRGEFQNMVYFGMKAGIDKAAGTYANTVVFTVVANSGPVTPDEPVQPDPVTPTPSNGGGENSAPKRLAVTRPATEADKEDAAEDEYEAPQGVEEEYNYDENIHYGSNMAGSTAVVIAGTVAAGLILFVVAKRRDDDDEEEEA